jgi:hypothetical protein
MSRTSPPLTQAQPLAQRRKYKVDIALARKMRSGRASGQSVRSIARELRLHPGTIRHWCRDTNYDPLPWVKREEAAAA